MSGNDLVSSMRAALAECRRAAGRLLHLRQQRRCQIGPMIMTLTAHAHAGTSKVRFVPHDRPVLQEPFFVHLLAKNKKRAT
jgi:hypothetical protein